MSEYPKYPQNEYMYYSNDLLHYCIDLDKHNWRRVFEFFKNQYISYELILQSKYNKYCYYEYHKHMYLDNGGFIGVFIIEGSPQYLDHVERLTNFYLDVDKTRQKEVDYLERCWKLQVGKSHDKSHEKS